MDALSKPCKPFKPSKPAKFSEPLCGGANG